MRVTAFVALATLCAWGSPDVSAQATTPAWEKVDGGPGTGCSHDSTFAFFVHHGDPRRIMIYLEGGGACWNGATCDLKGDETYVSEGRVSIDPREAGGILDLQNPANPLRD